MPASAIQYDHVFRYARIAIFSLLATSAFGQLPPLATTANLRTVPQLIDGHELLNPNSWKFDVGQPTVRDGLIADEAELGAERLTCEVRNVRGDGVRIFKTKPPAHDRLQLPTLEIAARQCYRGIVVDHSCTDAILLNPRVEGCRDEGIWLEGGNATIIGGHSYGSSRPLKIGGHQLSGGATVNGMTFSDGEICCEILTNDVTLAGCYTQDGFKRNIMVGGQSWLENVRVRVRPADAEFPNPVGIEFTPAGNWSHDSGLMAVGEGSTGILLNADGCTIVRKVCCIGGSTFLRIDRPVSNSTITIDAVGVRGPPRFEINALGTNNVIRINGQVGRESKLPTNMHPSNQIWVNGERKAA